VLTALILLTGTIGLLQLRTPPPAAVDAPVTAFSARRVAGQLETFARQSRGIGMPGHDAAEAELVAALRAHGLAPQVQTTSVAGWNEQGAVNAGTVSNVVVRVPGTASTGAIALDAHYDSGPTGPGAADCGTCVTGVLELLRALRAGPALRNDVIAVFADGEETEMLGSAAFVEQHPWAKAVRVALGLDRTGTGGVSLLYATGADSGWLTREFAGAAPSTRTLSLGPALVSLLPGSRLDCDLGEYTASGISGLGFAYGADSAAYHTMRDTAAAADLGSVQLEGDQLLAFLRDIGRRDLTALPREPDSVAATVLPGVVVRYPAHWATPLAVVATCLVALLLVPGFRRGTLRPRRTAMSAPAVAAAVPFTVLAMILVWAAVRALVPAWQVTQVGSPQTPLQVAGLVAFAVALVSALHALVRRRVDWPDLLAGTLLLWTVAAWATALWLPTVSYLVLWPLLFAILPLGWAVAGRSRPRLHAPVWRVAALAVAAVPVLWLLPLTLYLVTMLLTRVEGITQWPVLGLIGLFVVPPLTVLWPQFDLLGEGRRRWVVPLAALATAGLLLGTAMSTAGFDATHPRPDTIAYRLDADSKTARWVSPDRRLDGWTTQFFGAGVRRQTVEFEGVSRSSFVTAAPVAALSAPEATVVSSTRTADGRAITLGLRSTRAAPVLVAELSAEGRITAVSVEGHPVELADRPAGRVDHLRLQYVGLPTAGIDLTVTVASPAPVTVEVTDLSHGLPETLSGFTVRPRPADVVPAPTMMLDATAVHRTVRL
jgi:Zn-dependent M28 family amino/carboxypeptidase